MTPSIEVRIEELVLEDVAAGDRHRVADALERTLREILRADGLATEHPIEAALERVDAGAFPVRGDRNASHFGSEIARAVHRTLVDAVRPPSGRHPTLPAPGPGGGPR